MSDSCYQGNPAVKPSIDLLTSINPHDHAPDHPSAAEPRKLRHSTKPILAAISGVAVGGGLEMALHCDVRFAARNARLGQPEININFIPPVGATQALVRLVGRPAALRYLYD